MRGLMRTAGQGARRAMLTGLLLAGAVLAGCGDDDDCNHVIQDVETLNDCAAIAVERTCSPDITWSNVTKECLVQKCGDCKAPTPTPTSTPESEE